MLLIGTAGPSSAAPEDPAGLGGPVVAKPGASPFSETLGVVGRSGPAGPNGPSGPSTSEPTDPDGGVLIDIDGLADKPSSSVTLILTLTLLSLAPAILLTCTSFTKVLVVLGLTRNALGLQQTPPNQVLAGLALFLSLFIMGPVLSDINDMGLQPYLDGEMTASQAFETGVEPLREFMLEPDRGRRAGDAHQRRSP